MRMKHLSQESSVWFSDISSTSAKGLLLMHTFVHRHGTYIQFMPFLTQVITCSEYNNRSWGIFFFPLLIMSPAWPWHGLQAIQTVPPYQLHVLSPSDAGSGCERLHLWFLPLAQGTPVVLWPRPCSPTISENLCSRSDEDLIVNPSWWIQACLSKGSYQPMTENAMAHF